MFKTLQKTGSFVMALLVLFSTMSFTVEKHFCGSILVDKAIFSEAKTCSMEEHMTPEEKSDKEDECCMEEKISVEGQEELKVTFDDLDLQQQAFLSTFTHTYIDLFKGLPEQVIPFKYYSPPLLVRDILVLDQTFLI